MEVTDERPKGGQDYDHWIHDGTVLVKSNTHGVLFVATIIALVPRISVMQYVMFNSVPLELVLPIQGLNTKEDRVKVNWLMCLKVFHRISLTT